MNDEEFEEYLQRFIHNQNVAKRYSAGFLTKQQQIRLLTEVGFVIECEKKRLIDDQ